MIYNIISHKYILIIFIFFVWIYVWILEKEMATHSSIIAWRIPWSEKSGRLQSIWSQRVKHDWVINTFRWGSQYYLQFLRREDELEHDHRRVSKAVRERTDGIEI